MISSKDIEKRLFEEPEKKTWSATDVGAADWALAKIKSSEQEYQQAINYLNDKEKKIKDLKAELLKKA